MFAFRPLIAALVWTVLLPFPAFATEAPECTLEALQSLCSALPEPSGTYVDTPSGRFVHPERRLDPSAPLKTEDTLRAESRVQERFRWVIERMVEEVKAGRAESELGEDQRDWIRRIQTLNLSVSEAHCSGRSAGGGGRYNTFAHAIEICSLNGLSHDAQLTWLIAHEAGHALDACGCQMNHYERVAGRDLPVGRGARLSPQGQNIHHALSQARHFTFDTTDTVTAAPEMEALLARWEREGRVRRLGSGIRPETHPLRPMMDCLVRNGIVTEDAARFRAGNDCRAGTGSETPSDLWGTRLAGVFMKERGTPARTPQERLAMLSQDSINLMCAKREGPKPLTGLNPSLWSQVFPTDGRYISERYRDEAVFLADPNIQQAIGCRPVHRYGQCPAGFERAMRGWGGGAAPSAPAPAPAGSPKSGFR